MSTDLRSRKSLASSEARLTSDPLGSLKKATTGSGGGPHTHTHTHTNMCNIHAHTDKKTHTHALMCDIHTHTHTCETHTLTRTCNTRTHRNCTIFLFNSTGFHWAPSRKALWSRTYPRPGEPWEACLSFTAPPSSHTLERHTHTHTHTHQIKHIAWRQSKQKSTK